jgi:hypothetical protein
MFVKKLQRLVFFPNEWSESFFLGHGDPKFLFLEEKNSKFFVTKVDIFVRVFHVMIWELAKKLYRLVFSEMSGPNHLFRPWKPQKLYF